MKRILIVLFVAFASMTYAQRVAVTTVRDAQYSGTYVASTDSTFTFNYNNGHSVKPITLHASNIKVIYVDGTDNSITPWYLIVVDGKFKRFSREEYKAFQKSEHKKASLALIKAEDQRLTNPNYAIGKAFKSTGSFALGFGLPCFVTGVVLMGVGHSTTGVSTASDIKTRANCATAGTVLTSTGGALTLIGIPLTVKGKQIMNLNFNYTGNGVGVSADF